MCLPRLCCGRGRREGAVYVQPGILRQSGWLLMTPISVTCWILACGSSSERGCRGNPVAGCGLALSRSGRRPGPPPLCWCRGTRRGSIDRSQPWRHFVGGWMVILCYGLQQDVLFFHTLPQSGSVERGLLLIGPKGAGKSR